MDLERNSEGKFRIEAAKRIAEELCDAMAPCAKRLEIVGSVRREILWVKDIEILIEPKMDVPQASLFEEPSHKDLVPMMRPHADSLMQQGILRPRLDKNNLPRWGDRMILAEFMGVSIDLFSCVAPESWGVCMAIRTGPSYFSKAIATLKSEGGMLEFGQRLQGWRLWNLSEAADTPTEKEVFEFLKRPYIEPGLRHTYFMPPEKEAVR